jgi:hypothetical protein
MIAMRGAAREPGQQHAQQPSSYAGCACGGTLHKHDHSPTAEACFRAGRSLGQPESAGPGDAAQEQPRRHALLVSSAIERPGLMGLRRRRQEQTALTLLRMGTRGFGRSGLAAQFTLVERVRRSVMR